MRKKQVKTKIKIDGKIYEFKREAKKDVLIDNYVFSSRGQDVLSVTWFNQSFEDEHFLIVGLDDGELERKASMYVGRNKGIEIEYHNDTMILTNEDKKGLKSLIKLIHEFIDVMNKRRD
jgi:hypothetical protein